MDQSQYQALIEALPRNEQAMLKEIVRLRNGASASDLRPVTIGTKTGKPLEYGLTREFARLQTDGLIRLVSKNPARYAAVPSTGVEEAAKMHRLKKTRTKKRRGQRARLVELRKYEHGDYGEFYRVHRRVIELSDYVARELPKMAFWAAAPKDEFARVVDELAGLQDAIDMALACLKQRADDDNLLSKIAKLEETKGRTAAEVATAGALAEKLRAQYHQRVGVLD